MALMAMTAAAFAAGCDRESGGGTPAPVAEMRAEEPVTSAEAPVTSKGPRVVFLGDSLTAGLGVEAEEAFPARLGELLKAEGAEIQVVNAGVSGDTTAGGLRRLDWLLKQRPDVVVVGLGGNDGLRGTDVKSSEENLRQIVRRAKEAGASVLLLGMMIPPNYGPDHATRFAEIYPRVAREEGAALVPFLLEGVGGETRLNQQDGIHPTAEGQERVARNVLPHLRELLRGLSKATTNPA